MTTATHVYLSTACLHGEHGYCGCQVTGDGKPKKPAECKFCDARCICECHQAGCRLGRRCGVSVPKQRRPGQTGLAYSNRRHGGGCPLILFVALASLIVAGVVWRWVA